MHVLYGLTLDLESQGYIIYMHLSRPIIYYVHAIICKMCKNVNMTFNLEFEGQHKILHLTIHVVGGHIKINTSMF